MKTRYTIASEVTQGRRFQALGKGPACLYMDLCAESDNAGRIIDAVRVARGYGLTEEDLEKLVSAGYVLEVGDVYFITHHWVNNKYESRVFNTAMSRLAEYESGLLAFAGDPGRSAYVIGVPQERHNNDAQTTLERHNNDAEQKGRERIRKGKESNLKKRELEEKPTEKREHECLCKKCQKQATYYTDENGDTLIDCPTCGVYPYASGYLKRMT